MNPAFKIGKEIRSDFWSVFDWNPDRIGTKAAELKARHPKDKQLSEAFDNLDFHLEDVQECKIRGDMDGASRSGFHAGLTWGCILWKLGLPGGKGKGEGHETPGGVL